MAWSYKGTPAAAQQRAGETLAPRAQLILSVEPSAIREDVLAAATAAAEEVCLCACLPTSPFGCPPMPLDFSTRVVCIES